MRLFLRKKKNHTVFSKIWKTLTYFSTHFIHLYSNPRPPHLQIFRPVCVLTLCSSLLSDILPIATTQLCFPSPTYYSVQSRMNWKLRRISIPALTCIYCPCYNMHIHFFSPFPLYFYPWLTGPLEFWEFTLCLSQAWGRVVSQAKLIQTLIIKTESLAVWWSSWLESSLKV